jgi:WD40 repeat protein
MISIWDVASGHREQMIAGHSGTVNQLVFSPSGDELLSSDTNGAVRVWDALPNREQERYFPATYELALSPQRTHLVGFGVGPGVQIWDVRREGVAIGLHGHQEAVEAATWSDDQRLVATASLDQTARVWDAATGRQLALMEGHSGWIFGVDVSPDARRLATGGADRTARIWDAATGEELLRLDHPQEVNTVQFNRDGTRLFTGLSQSGDVMVWDSQRGALLATWSRHRFSIFAMALTADGTRLATASRDGEVRLWDAESGAEVLVLRGHTGDAFSVDFSPGGTLIATASNDATVRLWDAATGREVRAVPTGESAASAAFLDDSHLVVSTVANSATIVTLDIEELISLGHQRLTRTWTAEECRQYLQAETCPTGR